MFVEKIESFCASSMEADVYVSDGVHRILCFVHPIDSVSVYQKVMSVEALFCSDLIRAEEKLCAVQKLPGYYAYAITAKVVSRAEGFVCVGDIPIQLDCPVPKDILEGEYVFFTVGRLDALLH